MPILTPNVHVEKVQNVKIFIFLFLRIYLIYIFKNIIQIYIISSVYIAPV